MSKIFENENMEAFDQSLRIEEENLDVHFILLITKDYTKQKPIALHYEPTPEGKKKILEASETSLESIVGVEFDDALAIVNYVVL